MKRINLIPPEFATGKKALVETGLHRQAVLVGILLAAGLAVHYGMNFVRLGALKSEMTILQADMAKAQQTAEAMRASKNAVASQMEHLSRRREVLSKKKNYLLKLQAERLKWSEALAQFHKVIPEKVWVNELVLDPKQSRVKGGTFGNEQIGTFIDGLNGSAYFRRASFERTEASQLNQQPVINFELSFELARKHGL